MDQRYVVNSVNYADNTMIREGTAHEVENGRRECESSLLTMLTGVSTYMPGKHIAGCPVRDVSQTDMRHTKILGYLRVHLRSVGCLIGTNALLEFVHQVIRQDLQN